MSLAQIAHAAHEAAKETKVEKIKDSTSTDPESVELLSMLDGYRNGESTVHALMFAADFDSIMRATQVLASGFGCDVIVLINESFHATSRENPVTGKRWAQGEMQEVARKHDGVQKGWVKESLGTMAINRAGDIVHVLTDFIAVQEPTPAEGIVSWSLTWGETTTLDTMQDGADKVQLFGRFPEVMTKIMNAPTLLQQAFTAGIGPDKFGLDTSPEGQEHMYAHMDCAVVKAVSSMGLISAALALQAPIGSIRAAILEESLASMPNVLTPEEMSERFVRNPDGPPA